MPTNPLDLLFEAVKILKNTETLITLFISLVRSKLEYAAVVWHPLYEIHKSSLERVQRRFSKFLWFKIFGHYPEQGFPNAVLLQQFNMVTTDLRHANAALSFLYKILNFCIDCPFLLNKLNILISRQSARAVTTFYPIVSKTNTLKKSPINVMCYTYNKISDKCDIFNCTLKHLLKTYELSSS